jgi:plastocyanin
MMPRAAVVGGIASVLFAMALLEGTGCTPAGRTPHAGSVPAGAPAAAQVVDTAFQPGEVIVTAGSEVRWSQSGRQPHSVTAADGSFDSSPTCSPLSPASCLHQSSRFSHAFSQPGTYRYYCRVHGTPGGMGMVGAVVVKPAA